jgi:hypothetical protein
MLDPAFAYRQGDLSGNEAVNRLPQRVVQERYALVWSLAIDARLDLSRRWYRPFMNGTVWFRIVSCLWWAHSNGSSDAILDAMVYVS